MGLARGLLLRGSESRWLRQRFAHRPFVQRAVRRFMPGENLADALAAARGLADRRIAAVLTLLGENVTSAGQAREVAATYRGVVDSAAAAGLDADLSVKPTHLGMDLDEGLVLENLDALISAAGAVGRFVAIDMESSGYVDRTLDLFRELRVRHLNVGICLQAYLRRTEADLESLLATGPMIRLVKGAYKEPPELAWPAKSDVDRSYLRIAGRLLEARAADPRVRIAFGTHDERMIRGIIQLRDELGLPPEACEFQLLYGIGRELQTRLADAGCPVRVLVSYGTHWFPWYMRRLAERPANVGFVLRSMLRR